MVSYLNKNLQTLPLPCCPLPPRSRAPLLYRNEAIGHNIIGAIAAVFYQQVLWAVIPLTLALTLNMANRQRVELMTRVQNTAAIADVYQIVESLHSSDPGKSIEDRLCRVEGSLIKLIEAIASVQQRLEKLSPTPEPLDSAKIRGGVRTNAASPDPAAR